MDDPYFDPFTLYVYEDVEATFDNIKTEPPDENNEIKKSSSDWVSSDNPMVEVNREISKEADNKQTDASRILHVPKIIKDDFSFTQEFDENFPIKAEPLPETDHRILEFNEYIQEEKRQRKKQCCFYCKSYVTNLAQHLERKHSTEDEVQEFMLLPKNTEERKEIIDIIRKRGNYESAVFNQKVVPTRISKKNDQDDYKFCPKCKGAYSKESLRKHYKNCETESSSHNNRGLMILSRRVYSAIHPTASESLKQVFSRLRDKDNIVRVVKWDPLIISYGNKLCAKLKDVHHYKGIRAKIRFLGRFLLGIRKTSEEITNLASVYQPRHYRNALKVVNEMAHLNDDSQLYENPAVATSLGTLLKKVGKHLKSVYIEKGRKDLIQDVEDFLHLLHEDYSNSVNKTAYESSLKFKRSKPIELPSHQDIRRLFNFACEERNKMYKDIKTNGFKFESWNNLAELTLISLQVFNRRHSGETERITVEDVANYQKLDCSKDKEVFMSLDLDEKNAAEKYIMIRLRGKLGREVYIIADKRMHKSLKMIITYRKEAGVLKNNPYVFGLKCDISDKEFKHLSACALMRKYSLLCGAKNPALLRGTLLRKHMATQAAVLGLPESDITDLANHLGHEEKIHKEYYRLPVATKEITQMSRLLNNCLGVEETSKKETPNHNSQSSSLEHDEAIDKPLTQENIFPTLKNDLPNSPEDHSVISTEQPASSSVSQENSSEVLTENELTCNSFEYEGNNKNLTKEKCEGNLLHEDLEDLKIILTPIKICPKITKNSDKACHIKKAIIIKDPSKSISSVLYEESSTETSCLSASSSDVWTPTKGLDRHHQRKYQFSSEDESDDGQTLNKKCNVNILTNITIRQKITRVLWSTPEKRIARNLFKEYLDKKKLPPYKEIKKAVQEYPDLQNRTAKQLYAWLNNQNKSVQQKLPANRKNLTDIRRKAWTTPEKNIVRKLFGNFLKCGRLPPFIQCQVAVKNHEELKERSAEKLYAYINNIKKNQNMFDSPSGKCQIDIRSPEKQVVRRLFTDHIEEGKIPSNDECAKAITDNSILRTSSVK